jgi:hypothetical protein
MAAAAASKPSVVVGAHAFSRHFIPNMSPREPWQDILVDAGFLPPSLSRVSLDNKQVSNLSRAFFRREMQ